MDSKIDSTHRHIGVSGASFLISLTTAVTSAWKAATYTIAAYVSDGSSNQVSVPVSFPTLIVTQNIASNPTGSDPRTWAQIALASIEATIGQLVSRTVTSASVNGQTYTLSNITELFTLRERLRSEVAREEAQARLNAGLGAGNKVGIRFRRLASVPPTGLRVPWQ